MTDTARDHLERAVAWLTDLESERDAHCPGALRGKPEPYQETEATRMGAACAEVRHALELLAIPPREPTEKMIEADKTISFGTLFSRDLASVWRAMYDAAMAEKEGK